MISPSSSSLCSASSSSLSMASSTLLSSASSAASSSSASTPWNDDEAIYYEELKDVLRLLQQQEETYTTNDHHRRQRFHRTPPSSPTTTTSIVPPFYDSWRPVMISWMYHVADTFRLMPIVVPTGVYILDTCTELVLLQQQQQPQATTPEQATQFQQTLKARYPLMTMTALNLAVKCHETKMFPLDQLVQLLGGGGGSGKTGSGKPSYTPDDICACERQMLHTCHWKVHKPTTHDYLLRFVTVFSDGTSTAAAAAADLPPGINQRDIVLTKAVVYLKQHLMLEHVLHSTTMNSNASRDSPAAPLSNRVVAYAALLLAMEECGTESLSFVDKQHASRHLFEVGNLSASTMPQFQTAYNWLLHAKALQYQLEHPPTTPPRTLQPTPSRPTPLQPQQRSVSLPAPTTNQQQQDASSKRRRASYPPPSSTTTATTNPHPQNSTTTQTSRHPPKQEDIPHEVTTSIRRRRRRATTMQQQQEQQRILPPSGAAFDASASFVEKTMSLVDETVRDLLGSVPRNPDEEHQPRRITTSTSLVSTGETSCSSSNSSVCTGTTSSSYGQVLFCSDRSEGDAFEVIANETNSTSASDTDTESDDDSNDMSLDTSTATYDGMDDDDEEEVNEDDTDMIDEIAENDEDDAVAGHQRLLPTVIEEEDEEQQHPYPQHYAVPSNRTSIVPNTDTQECDIRMLVLTESMDGIEVPSVVGHEADDQSRTIGTVKSDCSTAG